ncbi:MAG: hypothetical protein WA359_06110, partial [Acidimicrobiales bacterium]
MPSAIRSSFTELFSTFVDFVAGGAERGPPFALSRRAVLGFFSLRTRSSRPPLARGRSPER